MADETTIEPDGSRRLFNQVEAVAGDLEAALARVRSIRSSLHEPWGTDEYGKRFSKQREPNAETTLGYLREAITSVRDLSKEGKGAVEEFINTDQDNATGLRPKS
jgi:hypothetical protein